MSSYLGWFDDEKNKKLVLKLEEGAERYEMLNGVKPDLCLITPDEFAGDAVVECGIYTLTLRPTDYVRPNHYWIGRMSDEDAKGSTRTNASRTSSNSSS